MKKGVERHSAFGETVLNEVAILRAWGSAEQQPIRNENTQGFLRRRTQYSSRFLLGFNPLAPRIDGEIGDAIASSAAAWITVGGLYRWNVWDRVPVDTPERLSIKLCDAPSEYQTGSLPKINFQLNLDYRLADDSVSIVSEIISPGKVLNMPPEFLTHTIDAIKRASRFDLAATPPNNESIQR